MSEPESNNVFSIETIQFPNHLLLPSTKNILKLRITNNSDKKENIRLELSGERLKINIKNKDKNEISIPPDKNIIIELELIPEANGYGVISMDVVWLNKVEFMVKVQKIRDQVPKKNIDTLWEKYKTPLELKKSEFNPDEFLLDLSKGEIKKLKKNICKIEDEIEVTPPEEAIKTTELTNELRECLRTLVKVYVNNKEFDNALAVIRKFPREENQQDYLRNIIRTYFFIDFKNMLDAIDLIEDVKDKQKLMKIVFFDLMEKNPENALEVLEYFKDEKDFYINNLFQMARMYIKNDDSGKAEQIFMQIYNIVKIEENSDFEIIRDVIMAIAEVISPEKADELILSMGDQELKEKVARDLFDAIYIMVEESRQKFDTQLLNSFRYHVNISTEQGKNITEFANMGGNISANILAGQFDFKFLLISLFSHEFSLYPTFDRLYSDITYDEDKSIGYVLFPSKNNLDKHENTIISDVLKKLIVDKTEALHIFIYNVDFIPYLGKPTIIIGTEEKLGAQIEEKLENLSGKINTNINSCLFEGGKTIEYLINIFNQQNIQPINLVFSYEFINQYQIFKDVFLTLI